MPPDRTSPHPDRPTQAETEENGLPIPPVLSRNAACLSCRKRKLRCSAEKPACATCVRSHNHIMKHLKPGQRAPVLHCDYDDPNEIPKPSAGKIKTGSKKVDKLENRVLQLEGLLRQVVGPDVVDAVGSGQPWNAQAGPSSYAPTSYSPQPMYSPQPAGPYGTTNFASPSAFSYAGPVPTPSYSHPSPTAGLDLLASSSSAPPPTSSVPRPHQGQQPPQHQAFQPSSYPFPPPPPPPHTNGHHQHPSGSITEYQSSPDFSPVSTPRVSASAPRRSDSGHQQDASSPAVSVAPHPSPPPFIRFTTSAAPRALSRKFNTFPPSEPIPSSFGPSANQTDRSQASSMKGQEGSKLPNSPADEQVLSLLWPSWPPHLPAPGFMQHIVEMYFNFVPFSSFLLNRPRFITRLALPPTHHLFPHPAVLHSICAITARYTSLPLHDPADVIRETPFSKKARSKRSRLDEGTKPMGDGLSAPLEGEQDFGELHANWAKIYFEQSVANAEEWLDLTLAAVLLGGYLHQHARWVEGWTWIGQAVRLAIPLGLNAFQKQPSGSSELRRLYLIPAAADTSDEIDRVQRCNLFWMLYCHDTFASTTSGWASAIPVADMTICLPVHPASSIPAAGAVYSAQNNFTSDVFTNHPPETTTVLSLMMKAAMLIRQVNDLLRKLESMGCQDYRQQLEFQQLDTLITAFQRTFPAEYRDLLQTPNGNASVQSVNPELLSAQCLPWLAVVCLHSSSAHPSDPSCPSSMRVREATSALLDRLWIVSNASFDFTILHPFTVFTWYSAAKSLLPFAEEAQGRGDYQRAAGLRSEVDVFRSAIGIIGQKLPIGLRTVKMLDDLIELVEKRSRPTPLLTSSPNPNTKFPLVKVAHTWIGADVIDKALGE